MKSTPTAIPGVTLLHPPRFADDRGVFRPVFADRLHGAFRHSWVEMNLSSSEINVIRGLHFQKRLPQAKLITVVSGTIFDVAVDLRPGPGFGSVATFRLSASEDGTPSQIYLPAGLAHGLATPEGPATIAYLVSEAWIPGEECVLAHDDPDLGIVWPVQNPILSSRDQSGLPLAEVRPFFHSS